MVYQNCTQFIMILPYLFVNFHNMVWLTLPSNSFFADIAPIVYFGPESAMEFSSNILAIHAFKQRFFQLSLSAG